MLVSHAAVRPHHPLTFALSVTLILTACSRTGDGKPADTPVAQPQALAAPAMSLADFKEPLSQYPVAELYSACRAMALRREGQSGELDHLRLVPMTTSIDGPVESWQANGKFVGVVENSGTTFNAQYNVNAATSPTDPGVSCAWFGFDQGTQQLMLRLVGPDSIKNIKAVRDAHDPPHTVPLAEWRTKAGLPVPIPGNSPNLVAEVPWWVCDSNGCCKTQ